MQSELLRPQRIARINGRLTGGIGGSWQFLPVDVYYDQSPEMGLLVSVVFWEQRGDGAEFAWAYC